MPRATFSLDDETIGEIKRTAARLRKSQSLVVREAVAEYAARADRLSERERIDLLTHLARLREAKPTRSTAEVDRELADLRASRRGGGRRHRSA